MKCINEEILQQYVDGECDEREQIAVQKHIESCKDCYSSWEQCQARMIEIKSSLNILIDTLPAAPPFPVPAVKVPKRNYALQVIVPLAVAASLLLLIWLGSGKDKNSLPLEQVLQVCFATEVDANKPAHQQEFTITVVSPDGKVSEIIVQ